jgi:hypothetical protein
MESGSSDGHRSDPITEMYSAEYKLAAERYENIYRGIWQNFSYMAALSAGILTFGSRSLALHLAISLATLPLLFWFFATYLPMDHYARGARRRAATIETLWSSHVFKELDGSSTTESATEPVPPIIQLQCPLLWLSGPAVLAILGGCLWLLNATLGAVLVLISIALSYIGLRHIRRAVLPPITEGSVSEPVQTPFDKQRMRHFFDFGHEDPVIHWGKQRFMRYFHVNQVIEFTFLVLTLLALASWAVAIRRPWKPHDPSTSVLLHPDTIRVEVEDSHLSEVSATTRAIRNQIDELRSQALVRDSMLRVLMDRLQSNRQLDTTGHP